MTLLSANQIAYIFRANDKSIYIGGVLFVIYIKNINRSKHERILFWLSFPSNKKIIKSKTFWERKS